jgi:septum formation protein
MIILASTSAARRAMLSDAGLAVECCAPGVDEAAAKPALLAQGVGPRDMADALAELKAVRVSQKRTGLVIGADQTLELEGALMDKADSLSDLEAKLRSLRGRVHKLHSAVVVAENGVAVWRTVKSAELHMRPFSEAFLADYIQRNGLKVLSAVGGYHLEGEGVQLFTAVRGDYFTILGLPLVELLDFLRIRGEEAN